MSVSLLEVIQAGGYDLKTYDDALWLLSTQNEYAELVDNAQDLIVDMEDRNEDTSDEYLTGEEDL